MVFYSRLKHNIVVFCFWDTFFLVDVNSILRSIICCEKHKECHRRCFCCVLFLLSMFMCSLFVFELLLIPFRIGLWPSVKNDCPISFSLFKCHLGCAYPSLVWCLGRDVELDCIGSWSLPFCLLFTVNPSSVLSQAFEKWSGHGTPKAFPECQRHETGEHKTGVWGISPMKMLGSEML